MQSKLPSFVFGYHGCDESVKSAVLFGKEHLRPSTNDYDWLGRGIYFWEQNAERAMDFAQESCRLWNERGRGLFQEGPPVYEGSGVMKETHIQIAVRNIDCIIAYFDPRKELENAV